MTDELSAALDEHEHYVRRLVGGDLGFWDFIAVYDSFYWRWELNGSEDGEAEWDSLIARYAKRVDLHRRIDDVLGKVCSDSDAQLKIFREAGRYGSVEATRLIREILAEFDRS